MASASSFPPPALDSCGRMRPWAATGKTLLLLPPWPPRAAIVRAGGRAEAVARAHAAPRRYVKRNRLRAPRPAGEDVLAGAWPRGATPQLAASRLAAGAEPGVESASGSAHQSRSAWRASSRELRAGAGREAGPHQATPTNIPTRVSVRPPTARGRPEGRGTLGPTHPKPPVTGRLGGAGRREAGRAETPGLVGQRLWNPPAGPYRRPPGLTVQQRLSLSSSPGEGGPAPATATLPSDPVRGPARPSCVRRTPARTRSRPRPRPERRPLQEALAAVNHRAGRPPSLRAPRPHLSSRSSQGGAVGRL